MSRRTVAGGPLLLSPSRSLDALGRELISRTPQEFKTAALSEIRALWPAGANPFAGAFGNKPTDAESYNLENGNFDGEIIIVEDNKPAYHPGDDADGNEEVDPFREF